MRRLTQTAIRTLLFLLATTSGFQSQDIFAQAGGHTLFGDLKVDESKVDGLKPLSFQIILYTEGGVLIAQQTVSNNGRYRFSNVNNGNYDVAVQVEGAEVARIRVYVSSPFRTDQRQDIALEWRSNVIARPATKAATVSAEDFYERGGPNKTRFVKAQDAIEKKRYEDAHTLLQQIVSDDPNDFQAWSELGTVYLAQKDAKAAEKAYIQAVEHRPKFFLALMNLGKLRVIEKSFEGAISVLTEAVQVRPTSAEANYLLGEAYLQVKKGSKAVGYLYEALRLDPVGKADAHLRLAALYNGAGLKDKAAVEYQEFLKKKPDYPEKKKLEQYIAQNKKP